MRVLVRCTTAAALAMCLMACNSRTTDAERARLAEAALDKADYRAALIDYVKLTEANPDNVDAANGVIRASLALNEPTRAVAELERIKARHPTDPVVLGAEIRVLAFSQQWEQIVTVAAPDGAAMRAESAVSPIVIEALLRTRRHADADRMLDDMLKKHGDETVFISLKARTAAQSGRTSDALKILARSRRRSPHPALALLEAQILSQVGRAAEAEQVLLATLREAPSLSAVDRAALLTDLISVQIGSGRVGAANSSIEELERISGPSAATSSARIRMQSAMGDHEGALEALETFQGKYPRIEQATCMRGEALSAARRFGDAEAPLMQCLASFPDDKAARRLLARAQVNNSKFDAATRTLEPLRRSNPFDTDVLAAELARTGRSASRGGRELVLETFARSRKSTADRIDASRALIAFGNGSAAREMLSAKVDWRGLEQHRAKLRLMTLEDSTPLASVDTAVRELLGASPEDPASYLLAYDILQRRGLSAQALRILEDGIQRAPFSVDLLVETARLALLAGRLEAAEKYIHRGRSIDPKNPQLVFLDYRRQLEVGDPENALATLESGVGIGSALPLRVELVKARLAAGRLSQSKEDIAALEGDGAPKLLTAQLEAELLIRQRRPKEAVATLLRVSAAGASDPQFMLRLGVAQLAAGERVNAERSLRRAIKLAPGAVAPTRALVGHLLGSGRQDDALDAARVLRAALPRSAVPLIMEAEVHALSGDALSSRRLLNAAFDLDPGPTVVIQRYAIEKRFDAKAAEKRLEEDARRFPSDYRIAVVLSEARSQRGDLAGAITALEAARGRTTGGRYRILNNLAWLYQQANDPRALETARDAAALAPNDPNVLDTLGWILYRSGKPKEGLAKLRDAYTGAPDNAEIALHLLAAERTAGEAAKANTLAQEWRTRHPELAGRLDSAGRIE